MNLQWSSPVPSIRAGRAAHKRLDSDDHPPAKCARLSVESGDSPVLAAAPGSPVSPVPHPVPAAHQGPSRIGAFLLLPLADRDNLHSAMNTDTGDELLCKVYNMGVYQEKVRAYGILPPHKNVAGIRDIILGEHKAYVFLDKDFGDMHTLVKSCRRLEEGQACRLFRQVALAVAHCHQAGIVLGDLKLRKFVFANVKRTHVRLESLDDCRILEDPNNDFMSDTHGCPAYVSPEILSGSTPYSGKMADMWSLGVMLYTMLVGRYPFHDPDPGTLFSKIRRGQCCLPEGLSPRAKCLILSLLRKEPSERLTATELLTHPWFHQPPSSQEVAPGEQEVTTTEQMVPSFDVVEEDDLFC
ncbi:tribbles homolog 1 [Synchiropus splendidus]|uniref:tribbles homolog 1 n=1 Tax=Synchiropus splendidus TaxID=270530 RepID=UPI00237E620C|nr:tribbles homolog 1 [Synchiropus splendidus]XP_053719653.1 tribbles homolog 1 [Synchiropus splendidus]